jgi:hypothetical protein
MRDAGGGTCGVAVGHQVSDQTVGTAAMSQAAWPHENFVQTGLMFFFD